MKLRRIFVFGMIVIAMAWTLPVFAADVLKIGVVDFQKVLTESESGKSVEAMMQKRGKEMESGLRDTRGANRTVDRAAQQGRHGADQGKTG